MDVAELLISQLTDVFRIGLLAALLFTMQRNRANTGMVLPLILGVVFVAVIIAVTMPVPGEPFWRIAASGFVANMIILTALWAIWSQIRRRS
jgi:membrane protein YdbS with pleckstrin-like domain